MASIPNTSGRFVVGVDFGTTFTSVAFAHSGTPNEVKLVLGWPNRGATADQVPTELQYTDPVTRKKVWGYEANTKVNKGSSSPELLQWFKLLLQERPTPAAVQAQSGTAPIVASLKSRGRGTNSGSGLISSLGGLSLSATTGLSTIFAPPATTPARKTAQKLQQLGIPVVTVVKDFLSAIRQTTIQEIEKTYGNDWVRRSKIQYVLTVPAIWSDAAKSLMVQAAEGAGFGTHRVDFSLVGEPEAAAAHTLHTIQPNHLTPGDTFIICDAGGGTVDLISYKITNLNPLQTVESVSGTGDLCGSVYLNERFEQHIRNVLGDDVIDGMKPRAQMEMFRTWEEKVKFKFGSKTDLDFEVTVPGIPDDEENNVEGGFYTMKSDVVKKIFDPVVEYIVRLVKQQVQDVHSKGDTVAAILLVGGFGSSQYLHQRLQTANYGINNRKPIEVLQPPNALTAIARGALLRGLDGSIVKERCSTKNYGCTCITPFIPGKGMDAHMFWAAADDKYMVEGNLKWHITRNQVIGVSDSTSIEFYRLVSIPANPSERPYMMFTDELLACDLDNAPDFKWKNPNSIYRVSTLRSDLSSVPLNKFQKWTNSAGQRYYKVNYHLTMSRVSEVLKFELLFDGLSRGSVTAEFE
ncbi:actin-like ATPase domain-containing protein [Wilcoxina mikolae CBS 423.85]|nr:actin-like ATPase domain-containing protein [Wilcoxina mikolae CBS 423.85]